jgi:hypothetical protein
MIAENELRIGNSVFYNGDINEIGVITEIRQSFDPLIQYVGINGRRDLYYRTKHIKPIPLTEEWLVKFGFEWSVRHQAYKKARFVYVIDFYKEHPQYENSACFLNREHRSGDCLVCLEYVHQLQNLYFALTGQELTLKQ